MLFATQLFWAVDDTSARNFMAQVSRSRAAAPTPSTDSPPVVNPKVLLAEAMALQCAKDRRYLSYSEFRRRIFGFSEGDTRNERAHFSKLLNRLTPDERKRILAAQAEATGEKVLAPETIRRRLLELAADQSLSGRRVAPKRFYEDLFAGIETVRVPTSFRNLYAAVRRVLPDDLRSDLDHARTTATGLEPKKGGVVRVNVEAVLRRAEHFAQQVVDHEIVPFTAAEFQRRALDIDENVLDSIVRRRFSALLLGLPVEMLHRFESAQAQAMAAPKKAPTRIFDLDAMVERGKSVAREVATQGQPVSLLEFYQRALGYNTTNLETLKVRASQYAGRLSPDAKKIFEAAKAVAIGKKTMTGAEAGQVFAPDAGKMEEIAAQACKWGSETFVPATRLPEAPPTPLQPVDHKIFQLPGLLADVMDVVKPLGFPVSAINWKKFAIPPSEGRLYAPVSADVDSFDLPSDPVVTAADAMAVVAVKRESSWLQGLRISIPAPNQQVIVLTGGTVLVVGALMVLAAPVGI